jgi:hypothetical protein
MRLYKHNEADKNVANQTRRHVVGGIMALALHSGSTSKEVWNGRLPSRATIPRLPHSWADARRIIGERGQYTEEEKRSSYVKAENAEATQEVFYNDFCFIRDKIGRWHCIGIEVNAEGKDEALFHGVSDSITGPYVRRAPIYSGSSAGSNFLHMWAPFALWTSDRTAAMFYGHLVFDQKNRLVESTMRRLESHDPGLEVWKPAGGVAGGGRNVLFEERNCRDPMIVRDNRNQDYVLYYASSDDGNGREAENVLKIRTSKDLETWGAPRILMSAPPGYVAPESPCVLEKDGLYYLWVSGFDYGRMSLYISEDPLNFGDATSNRIMEQSGHAAEIVFADRSYWMACVSIANHFGNAPAVIDLPGVYLQRLEWVEAEKEMLNKVIRRP